MTTSLLSGRWRAMATALATVTLLGAAACRHRDVDARPDPRVWVVDLHPDDQRTTDLRATLVGDRYQVTMRFAVYATVCAPEADREIIAYGGGYGHINCLINPVPGTVREVDSAWPHLRVRELTATAHVTIVAEYGTQEVKTLVSRDVGPLTMGEPLVLEPVSWQFDPSVRPANNNASTSSPYRIHARISDCQLSNRAACGNNSHRYFFDPPAGIGTSEQGLNAAAATLTIPDRAGGLTKVEIGSGQEGGRTTQPDNRPVGGVPVRRTVQGLFLTGNGPGGAC